MDGNKELYLNTPPGRLFRKAAIPGSVSMLAATLFSLVDGIFVGQICGDVAFAAANLAIPFTIINFALAEMIGTGSSVPISILLGRGEKQKANNYFSCACILIVLTGILMGILFFWGAEPIMALMGADGELQQMAADYLKVYAVCSPVVTITFAVDNYLRICGKNKMSMFLNIFNYGLNIVMDFTFLAVLKWPVWSAALATCISMMTSTIIGMVPFALRRFQLRFCRPVFSGALFRQVVAGLFLQPEELVLLDAAARVIRIYALTFVSRWFGFAIQSLFTAIDKPVPATILSLGYACAVPLVLMALLWNMGLDGLWLNSPLTSLLVAVIAGILIVKAQKSVLLKQNEIKN